MFITILKNFPDKPVGAAAGALFIAGVIFCICFAALSLSARSLKKRQEELEREEDEKEETEETENKT